MEKTCEGDHDLLFLPHDDVLIQILVYLPAISLLRFKSVCKSWRALINSSFFIHLHATTTTNTLHYPSSSKFGTFIFQTIQCDHNDDNNSEILMLSAAAASRSHGHEGDNIFDEDQVLEVKSLGFPPHYKVNSRKRGRSGHEILMVGSCNGLICLHDSERRDVSLWNPVTRQFRILRKSLTLDEEGIGDFVAFGFDIKTKDYKVVQITWFSRYNNHWLPRKEYAFRVQVYSLSTDSWRLLEGINSLPARPQQGLGMIHGLYLNGCYIFEGYNAFGYLILSFDFTKEIFTTMEFPNQDTVGYGSKLCYLGEKIVLFTRAVVESSSGGDHQSIPCHCDNNYDIWVLNEYGVKESWTKLHSNISGVQLEVLRRSCIGISNNGEFALIETRDDDGAHKLEVLNLVTNETKKDFLIGNNSLVRADVYKQSLVSVISVNGSAADADRVIGGAITGLY